MTHETACAQLQHWWELHGQTDDPVAAIRRITREAAPTMRGHLTNVLFDQWAQLCAEEGDTDDNPA